MFKDKMFRRSALVVAILLMAFSARSIWSQDAASKKDDAKKDEAKQEAPTSSVAPASVEITPNMLDVHVGEKVKFSASAKDASGNAIDTKPSVWFAAPFDLAGADESGEVTFHAPGVVTVGAVIAGKAGYATVNVGSSKVTTIEIASPAYPHCGRKFGKIYCDRAHGEWRSAQRCGD